ncbi:hypothetical protein [Yoonia sp. BS5-3]|uniref:Uncharacterized protein n=1 Tax=Yoonia phaeophyticola TaxID=3137369 RepID=A0ABZ2V953_9RHOB
MQKIDGTSIPIEKAFWAVLVLVIAIILLKAGVASGDIRSVFSTAGNDEVMRLVVVRDWLGGQAWYDTTQYRLMPPEGVVMHWSRYLDAMIGAIIVTLSWVAPIETAEMLAVAIWPTILMLLLVAMFGFGTRRIFGPGPACFAMFCAVFWPFTSDFYFSVGRIDHHNVQVVMLVVMTLSAIWPNRIWTSGFLAGFSAAFSLAIGLENLLYILVLGLLLLIRAILDVAEGTSRRLLAFCLALPVAAIVFWIGQTPPARLLYPVCDQLGTPVLTLIAIAVVASAAGMLPLIKRPLFRLAISGVVTIVGCAVAWPLLSPCLAGPYALLPEVVQKIISGSINEALPAVLFASKFPILYNSMMTPAVGAIGLAALIWWSERKRPDVDAVQRDAVGQLLFLSLVGFLASFSQIRLLSMTSPAVVLLAGYGLWRLFCVWRITRLAGDAAKSMAASVVILAPFLIEAPLRQLQPTVQAQGASQSGSCRDFEAMSALGDLPPEQVLTPMNLGSLLLLATHHQALSGPYHRSSDAYTNGLLPFQMPEVEMKEYVIRSGAVYLMLCRGANYGDGFATELAKGSAPDWLQLVDVEAGRIMMFEILLPDI